jgi:hypothetical protein
VPNALHVGTSRRHWAPASGGSEGGQECRYEPRTLHLIDGI